MQVKPALLSITLLRVPRYLRTRTQDEYIISE